MIGARIRMLKSISYAPKDSTGTLIDPVTTLWSRGATGFDTDRDGHYWAKMDHHEEKACLGPASSFEIIAPPSSPAKRADWSTLWKFIASCLGLSACVALGALLAHWGLL
jgi:hypothetical protein